MLFSNFGFRKYFVIPNMYTVLKKNFKDNLFHYLLYREKFLLIEHKLATVF